MNKELYLLRHGATPLNGLYVGSTDVSLAEEGREQALRICKTLVPMHIDQVFCSPMKRCRETMELLSLDTPVEIIDNLREIDFGRWEGHGFEEISTTDQELIENWRINGETFCFPDGECVKDFNKRVELFSRRVVASTEERILIIAHGGTIRHLLCTFLGLSPEKKMIFDIQPGCFSTVALYGDLGVLTGLNAKG